LNDRREQLLTLARVARARVVALATRLVTQQYLLLQRSLVYTGVTRGKKLVVVVGQRKALAIAVRNNRTEQRF